ncbi:MAG: SPOR domain-containing protein [Candidatus Acidiferrales bacterium]
MAGGGKRGGGDRILESRHLVGLFLGVVLLCAVFFTLGYVMGRTQYTGSVQAADSPSRNSSSALSLSAKAKNAAPPPAPSSEWDFYSKKDDNHIEPAAKPSSASPSSANASDANGTMPTARTKAVSATKPPARFQAPRMSRNAIVLQLAALRRESDALALADAVQQKRFPSFVIAPASDGLYRVQVGPYRDEKAATTAQHALEQAGFKAIIKR